MLVLYGSAKIPYIVDQEGIWTDPEKVRAVAQWPMSKTVKQIRQFLGLASWYRRFIQDFATVTASLTALTRKNARWHWGPDEATAFEQIKSITAPVLAYSDFSRCFYLQTDASISGLGVVLTQNFPEGERVIAYASRTLNAAEKNYSATELECRDLGHSPDAGLPWRVPLHDDHRPPIFEMIAKTRCPRQETRQMGLRTSIIRYRD